MPKNYKWGKKYGDISNQFKPGKYIVDKEASGTRERAKYKTDRINVDKLKVLSSFRYSVLPNNL